MNRFILGFVGLAGLAMMGAMTTAQAAEGKQPSAKAHQAKPHAAKSHAAKHYRHPRVYAADPYYYDGYGYRYRPLPVYVYGRGPLGIFDFPPDAPGGLLNPEPRPVNENPQQYMMNQLHDRPFSDDEPY